MLLLYHLLIQGHLLARGPSSGKDKRIILVLVVGSILILPMKKLRGGTHSTLTETAEFVVAVLETIPGIKKISPGIISKNRNRNGGRTVTAVITNAGFELIISGQGAQKVAVHCSPLETRHIIEQLTNHKRLTAYSFRVRERKPGI